MGGEAAMKSVSKIAGMNIIKAGVRGAGYYRSRDNPVSQIAGQATKTLSRVSLIETPEVLPVQAATWENDDWDFPESEDGDPLPRRVFGPTPAFEEAKSATSELIDVLEQASICSDVPDTREMTDYLSSESTLVARRALTLFHQSPAAQSVVASIVSDRNVWEAITHNPALQEFINANKYMDTTVEECCGDTVSKDEGIHGDNYRAGEDIPRNSGNQKKAYKDYLDDAGKFLFQMANNVVGFVKSIFGLSIADKADKTHETITTSFVGLAIMVIMLVIFKRI